MVSIYLHTVFLHFYSDTAAIQPQSGRLRCVQSGVDVPQTYCKHCLKNNNNSIWILQWEWKVNVMAGEWTWEGRTEELERRRSCETLNTKVFEELEGWYLTIFGSVYGPCAVYVCVCVGKLLSGVKLVSHVLASRMTLHFSLKQKLLRRFIWVINVRFFSCIMKQQT